MGGINHVHAMMAGNVRMMDDRQAQHTEETHKAAGAAALDATCTQSLCLIVIRFITVSAYPAVARSSLATLQLSPCRVGSDMSVPIIPVALKTMLTAAAFAS